MNIQPATPMAAMGVISRPVPPRKPSPDTEQEPPYDSLELSDRSLTTVHEPPPYVRSVNGVKSVSGGQILAYLKTGRNLLGWLAGVTNTSLMGRWVLSHFGPAGAFGPLGEYGPFGEGETGNVSQLITGHNWEELQSKLTDLGGPLSDKGPLSEHGPLSPKFVRRLLRMNNATWSLLPGHPLGLLGPGGVDGPLGIMGPMGPNGAHGYQATQTGEYVNLAGETVRHMSIPWNKEELRHRELYEILNEESARGPVPQDTSFMVEGIVENNTTVDSYRIKPQRTEWVTFHAVPARSKVGPEVLKELVREVQFKGRHALTARRLNHWNNRALEWFDQFSLEAYDSEGQLLASSESAEGPNWLQLRIPADFEVEIRVKCNRSWDDQHKPYRLFTTGSGFEIDQAAERFKA